MNKVWFITGCATGFGAALAQRLAGQGAVVVATDKDAAALAYLTPSETVLPLQLDVTRPDEIRAALGQAVERFGRLDVLVNNAGLGYGGAFEEMEIGRARLLFEVNTLGLMAVTQAALPVMRGQGGGHIINISSDSGIYGQPFQTAYCASKHAVEGFSEALSHEVVMFGIKVTVIEPCGFFATAMPHDAIAEAEKMVNPASPYYPLTAGALHMAKQGLPHANPAQMVVDAILEVAALENPPLRRAVGQADRTGVLEARRQMPDEAFIQMMRKAMLGG